MDGSMIIDIITSIGFPIAIAVYMLYWMRIESQDHRSETDMIVQQHREETKELAGAITELRIVMQTLIEKLDRE